MGAVTRLYAWSFMQSFDLSIQVLNCHTLQNAELFMAIFS